LRNAEKSLIKTFIKLKLHKILAFSFPPKVTFKAQNQKKRRQRLAITEAMRDL
jgi:hypothetical protein